jgi:hypothetical protein
MARMLTPLVEVTAPDGTSAVWAAIAIPYKEAVVAVKKVVPPGHFAELSIRKFPVGLKIAGARPGEVMPVE